MKGGCIIHKLVHGAFPLLPLRDGSPNPMPLRYAANELLAIKRCPDCFNLKAFASADNPSSGRTWLSDYFKKHPLPVSMERQSLQFNGDLFARVPAIWVSLLILSYCMRTVFIFPLFLYMGCCISHVFILGGLLICQIMKIFPVPRRYFLLLLILVFLLLSFLFFLRSLN